MPDPCPAVLALIPDASASSLWRVQAPFRALLRQGAPVDWAPHTTRDLSVLSVGRDALLLQRQAWHPERYGWAEAWVAQVHRAGKQVWTDWDDDYVSAASQAHLQLAAQQRLSGAISANTQFTLALSDGVTVSTEALARLVRPYTTAPVVVVPNAIDWAWWQLALQQAPARPDPRLTIGWAGAKRLEADFGGLLPVWVRLAARYPAVQFVLAGQGPADAAAVLPPDRLTVRPWRPIAEYPQNYAGIDIFCCPLADETFNQAKSPIKAFEAACAGAAVVASPTVYGTVLQHARTGLLATTAADWEAALGWLIEDAALRTTLAQRWAKRVRERHSLAQNLWRWPAAWRQLLAARQRVGVA